MEYRKFGDTYLLRMGPGEEILEQVKKLALAEDIRLATVQALGAVREFTVGVFDTVSKTYHANEFSGPYEIVSLTGTIDSMNGEFYSHLHMSAGDSQGHVVGGPLNRAPRNSVLAELLTLQALSVALQVEKDWDPVKYVRCHPGGKLGELRENEK